MYQIILTNPAIYKVSRRSTVDIDCCDCLASSRFGKIDRQFLSSWVGSSLQRRFTKHATDRMLGLVRRAWTNKYMANTPALPATLTARIIASRRIACRSPVVVASITQADQAAELATDHACCAALLGCGWLSLWFRISRWLKFSHYLHIFSNCLHFHR